MSESTVQELSEESKNVLVSCFQQYDKSGDGILNKEELPEAFKFAGINVIEDEIDDVIRLFDQDKDGCIQITELVDRWNELAQHSVTGDDMVKAFNQFDTGNTGSITLKKLKAILMATTRENKTPWTAAEVEKLYANLKIYDKNGDGEFDYPEFVNMFQAKSYPLVKPVVTVKKDITQIYKYTTYKDLVELNSKVKESNGETSDAKPEEPAGENA